MPSLEEIDEALRYAVESKRNTRDSKKHIINDFIDELLDDRNQISGVNNDDTNCVSA